MLAIRLQLLTFLLTVVASSASAEVIVTRDDVFYIPFTASDEVADQALSLFVSGDQGTSWQFYQQQPASAGRFSFRAGVDGEFWFVVRPSSESDGTGPVDFDQPELQVAIDRQQPQLELLANRTPAGQIVIQWSAEDPFLDPASLQIEFQIPDQNDWSQAEIDSPTIKTNGPITTGIAVLAAPADASAVHVRGYVKDRAGNLATTQRDYDPSSLPTTDLVGPMPSSSSVPKTGQVMTEQGNLEPFAVHGASRGPNMALDTMPHATNADGPPSDNIYGWQAGSPAPAADAADNSLADLPMAGGVAETNPMIANYPSTREPNVLSETSQRVSNSRRFELVYGVDAVSADQIHRVEVWYTDDGGRSWRHHGDDEDLVSPYLMEVDQDGVVGVRMLVQTRSGFTIRPPESGDPADVWIRVDATQPTARITSVRYGTGENAGALELYWEARDENLADRPILFLYGDSPQGPWRKVSDPLPNTGRYVWAVDDRAPAQIYFRIEVRDTAGNMTEETLPTPINNQRIAPRGYIRNVRPAALQLPGAPIAR